MKKLLYIVGPTASGKTALALQLSQEFSGDIVSADSVQVYKKLDIISGKDIPKGASFGDTQDRKLHSFKDAKLGYYLTPEKVRMYLLDVVEPTQSFNVSDFVSNAEQAIQDIEVFEKLPVVVGGTGFYVKALRDGIDTLEIPPHEELRKKLQSYTVSELQELLKEKDQDKLKSMNDSDRQNPRRLVRAIEITEYKETKGYPFAPLAREDREILTIGLTAEKEIIQERIDKRIQERLEIGALTEAKMLFENYKNLSEQVKNANGYKELFDYFLGKFSQEEAIKHWRKAEYLNAKNQMTWLKKDKRIQWFDISEKGFEKRVKEKVKKWIE